MEMFATYLNQDFVSYAVSFLGFFPAGILLGALAWMVGYLVFALLRLFKFK